MENFESLIKNNLTFCIIFIFSNWGNEQDGFVIERVKNSAQALNRCQILGFFCFSFKLSNFPFQTVPGVCPFKFMMNSIQLTLSWQLKYESNGPAKK